MIKSPCRLVCAGMFETVLVIPLGAHSNSRLRGARRSLGIEYIPDATIYFTATIYLSDGLLIQVHVSISDVGLTVSDRAACVFR